MIGYVCVCVWCVCDVCVYVCVVCVWCVCMCVCVVCVCVWLCVGVCECVWVCGCMWERVRLTVQTELKATRLIAKGVQYWTSSSVGSAG